MNTKIKLNRYWSTNKAEKKIEVRMKMSTKPNLQYKVGLPSISPVDQYPQRTYTQGELVQTCRTL